MSMRLPLFGLTVVCLATVMACEPYFDGRFPAEGADDAPADRGERPGHGEGPEDESGCDDEDEPDEAPADEPEPGEAPDPEPPPAEEPAACAPIPPPAIAQADVPLLPPLPAAGPDCQQLAGPQRPIRLGPHPASLPLEGACGEGGYVPSNYTQPAEALDADRPYEVHVVSVYDGDIPVPGRVGSGAVEVEIGATHRPVVLVLTGNDRVQWRLQPTPDARIAGVVAVGSEAPDVLGSPVPVQIFGRQRFCGLGYGWEAGANTGGGNHRLMMEGIRATFGQIESSFQGCYAGQHFTVPYAACPETTAPPVEPLDEQIDPAAIPIEGCDAITGESVWCATDTGYGLDLVGLDTGHHCRLGDASVGRVESMTWLGEALYGCGDYGLTRYRLDTRQWEVLEATCGGVAADGDDLLVTLPGGEAPDRFTFAQGTVFRFAGVAGLLAGQVIEQFAREALGRRIAVDGDILYMAWHSTDRVERLDMATLAMLPPVVLEGFDEWIHGMDVIQGMIVVQSPEGIYGFDAEDGTRLVSLPSARRIYHTGLACAAGAEPL